MFSEFCIFAGARAECYLPYCHIIRLRPGFDFLRIDLSTFFSATPEDFAGTHRKKNAHIISKGSWLAKAIKGIVPQERRRLLKKIKP